MEDLRGGDGGSCSGVLVLLVLPKKATMMILWSRTTERAEKMKKCVGASDQ
jgi:hypothetical protein